MALLGNFKDGYTKTGNGSLNQISGTLSYIPFLRNWIVGVFGYADTLKESGKWLLRGKVGSAVTTAVAGTVGTSVNVISDSAFWWANTASGLTTGRTLGTHARKLTETAIGGVTGVIGAKPQVLRSYPAGIGGIGGGAAQAGPGRYVTQVAQSRGEDPNAAYARLNSNQSDHLSALQAAQSQGGYRGM